MKSQDLPRPSLHLSKLLSKLAAAALALSFAGCSHSLPWSTSLSRPDAEAASASEASSSESSESTESSESSSPESAEPESAEPESVAANDSEDDAPSMETPSPAASSGSSVQLRSDCAETVALLYAEGSTDTTTRLDPGEVESHTFRPGAQVWVLDASEHKLAAASITASVREVTVGSDCTSVTAR